MTLRNSTKNFLAGRGLRRLFTSTLTYLAFGLGVTASASPTTFDFLSAPLTINPNSIVVSVDGITVTATSYHVEFSTGSSTIYGPFATGTNAFGPCARGFCDTGFGLRALQDLGQTDQDTPAGGAQPGFDNIAARGSLPSVQFALFSFSIPVDISQVIVDDTSNFGRNIFAAGGAVAPDLSAGFLGAFSGYTVVNSPDDITDGTFVHSFSTLQDISFLAVGTTMPVDVGNIGPFQSLGVGGNQFYINGLSVSPSDDAQPGSIPEPGSIVLMLSGFAAGVLCRKRRSHKAG